MTRPKQQIGPSNQSLLDTYMREVNETPILTADEEKELARQIEDGDSDARDRMVRANLRLVVEIARVYAGKGMAMQDLIEEGNLGLLRAVEGFDPRMTARFRTYASRWIKQSIKRALLNKPTQLVYLSYARHDRMAAAEVRKRLAAANLTLQSVDNGSLNYKIAKEIRLAVIESDAVILLATPTHLGSEKAKLEIAIADAWQKPTFVVIEDMSKNNLPDNLSSCPVFESDKISELADTIHRSGLNLSDAEIDWLRDWYVKQSVPLDRLIRNSELLSELSTQFRRTWGRGVAPERLLGGLHRARRQGKLPRLRRKALTT